MKGSLGVWELCVPVPALAPTPGWSLPLSMTLISFSMKWLQGKGPAESGALGLSSVKGFGERMSCSVLLPSIFLTVLALATVYYRMPRLWPTGVSLPGTWWLGVGLLFCQVSDKSPGITSHSHSPSCCQPWAGMLALLMSSGWVGVPVLVSARPSLVRGFLLLCTRGSSLHAGSGG